MLYNATIIIKLHMMLKRTSSTLNTVVPYIADALTLWTLKDYMTFDTSSVASNSEY